MTFDQFLNSFGQYVMPEEYLYDKYCLQVKPLITQVKIEDPNDANERSKAATKAFGNIITSILEHVGGRDVKSLEIHVPHPMKMYIGRDTDSGVTEVVAEFHYGLRRIRPIKLTRDYFNIYVLPNGSIHDVEPSFTDYLKTYMESPNEFVARSWKS